MRAPAYIARDGLIVGIQWNTAGIEMTIDEAAAKAEGFTRTAAETASLGLATSAMNLATDIINAIHAVKAEIGQSRKAA